MPPRWPLACLLIVPLALVGCLEDGREPVVEREETIEPGSFVELNLRMAEGGQIDYRWSTSPAREVAFDVHSHPSQGEVVYHERANATEGSGTFTASSEGTYSLLWENPTDEPVDVTAHVDGDAELASIQP